MDLVLKMKTLRSSEKTKKVDFKFDWNELESQESEGLPTDDPVVLRRRAMRRLK